MEERGTSRKEFIRWVDDYRVLKKFQSHDWWMVDYYDWCDDWSYRDYKCWKRYRKKQYRS